MNRVVPDSAIDVAKLRAHYPHCGLPEKFEMVVAASPTKEYYARLEGNSYAIIDKVNPGPTGTWEPKEVFDYVVAKHWIITYVVKENEINYDFDISDYI